MHAHVSHDPDASAFAGATHLLEELAAGRCTPDEFSQLVLEHERRDPEVVWETLALLDQYFRRKRIDEYTFRLLTECLQKQSLGIKENHTKDDVEQGSAALPVLSAIDPTQADVPVHSMHTQPAPSHRPSLRVASLHREIRPGDMLCGRYRIVEILRRDDHVAMAEAIDESKAALPGIRMRVALQVLEESSLQDEHLLQRIGKLQALSHPSIDRILDVAEDEGTLVVVSEFFAGSRLADWLLGRKDVPLLHDSALRMVQTLAGALAYAHARGMAHGDVSPENILVTDVGELRLQGFRLAAEDHDLSFAGDRRNFARLATMLLDPHCLPGAVPARRPPRGVSRSQWRGVRRTLAGTASANADLLAEFAPASSVTPGGTLVKDQRAPRPRRERSIAQELLAAGIVVMIIAAGVYLYFAVPSSEMPPLAAAPQPFQTDDPRAPTSQIPEPASMAEGENRAVPQSQERAQPLSPPTVGSQAARASVNLASAFAWVDTSERVVRISVTRRGNLDREVTFRWWTETGTAEVDRDFRAIASRLEVIPAGAQGVELLVPLIPDPQRREPRTFYVKIDEAGPGAQLGRRTLMRVAIVPPGYPAARDGASSS